jgi:hypothetical protein
LSSAESLRQETSTTLLRKKYGHSAAGAALYRWAGGNSEAAKSAEQMRAEESARTMATVREAVLWFLRRGLEGAVGVQRGMVEKRIERVREKEKSVLYKVAAGKTAMASASSASVGKTERQGWGGGGAGGGFEAPGAQVLSQDDTARIEAQLSPEQLQLFAEENDSMLRHYEDTLGKVQYVFSFFLFGLRGLMGLQECREIAAGDLVVAGDSRYASCDAGGVYLPACLGCGYDADERRAGKSGAEACYGAQEYGAGCVLGDCWVVHLACGLGFDILGFTCVRLPWGWLYRGPPFCIRYHHVYCIEM